MKQFTERQKEILKAAVIILKLELGYYQKPLPDIPVNEKDIIHTITKEELNTLLNDLR